MKVEIVCPVEQYKILYNLSPDVNIVVCIGGRGGAKTYSVSQYIAFSSTIKQKRCVELIVTGKQIGRAHV